MATECLPHSAAEPVVARLVEDLRQRHVTSVLRVAIDGPDTAGKTRLADELARLLAADRPVLRVSADGFHQPAEIRARRGELSAEGYYLDAFDYATIVGQVLEPLGPGGSGEYLEASFDLGANEPLPRVTRTTQPDAVLLFDGVFLLRPELRAHWDRTVYLHIDPDEALRRALERDVERFGSPEVVRRRYRTRYLPAQSMYRMIVQPRDRADIVLDMSDPANPGVLRWG